MQVRHVQVARVRKVAAADLGGTFQQVAHQDALAQLRPVVTPPAKGVHQRREEQRRVGHPAGDHHVGPCGQGRQQGLGAQVGVGGDQPLAQGRGALRPGAFRQRHVVRAHPVQHVVARHHRHAQARQAEFSCHRQHGRPGGLRVRRAHVADHPHALAHAGRQHGAHTRLQHRVIAVLGVAGAAQLRQRDGALGQALEHQRVQPTPLGQGLRGVDPVAGIAGTSADAKGFHAGKFRTGVRAHAEPSRGFYGAVLVRRPRFACSQRRPNISL